MTGIDWNAIGTYLLPIITGVVGWFTGRRKQDNDFLKELQESVNMLASENKTLIKEVVELRRENASLLANQESMKLQMDSMQKENEDLHNKVIELNQKLEGVKTITRKA